MNEIAHDATPGVPVVVSMQLLFVPENDPVVGDALKLALPVGIVGEFAVSVTVAVHDVADPTVTVVGEQVTPVLVGSGAVDVSDEDVPLLAACVASPL